MLPGVSWHFLLRRRASLRQGLRKVLFLAFRRRARWLAPMCTPSCYVWVFGAGRAGSRLLVLPGASWRLMMLPSASWRLLAGFRRFLMVVMGFRRFLLVFHWFPPVSHGLLGLLSASHGFTSVSADF